MANLSRVSRYARLLSFATTVFMIGLVLGVSYFFVDTDLGRDILLRSAPTLGTSVDLASLSAGTIRSMMVIGLMSTAVQLFILWWAKRLFDLYGAGEFLSPDCAEAIRAIGLGLLALPLVRFVQTPLWSILMTLDAEETSVSISVSSNGMGFLIGGALMLLIGWAMVEASRAAEENKGFV